MVPTAEMTVEATKPHKMLKPPLAETLAISVALLMSLSQFALAFNLNVVGGCSLSLLVNTWKLVITYGCLPLGEKSSGLWLYSMA